MRTIMGLKNFFVNNISQYNYSSAGISYISIKVDGKSLKLLIDTGAGVSVLKALSLGNNNNVKKTHVKLNGVAGRISVLGKVHSTLDFGKNIRIKNYFYVVPNFECQVDGILGLDFIKALGVKLDYERATMSFKYQDKTLEFGLAGIAEYSSVPARCEKIMWINHFGCEDCVILPQQACDGVFVGGAVVRPRKGKIPVKVLNINEKEVSLKNFAPLLRKVEEFNILNFEDVKQQDPDRVTQLLNLIDLNHLPGIERQAVQGLIAKYADIFHLPGDKLNICNVYEQHIRTKVDSSPVYVKPYRVPFSQKAEIRNQIQEMLDNDIIEPASSEWSSPILMVPKKTKQGEPQKWRLVVDYRKLNLQLIDEKFPLPNITDIFDSLAGAIYFSHLDLAQGYYQVGLDSESRKVTGFSTPDGQFQMKRLPMGLKISPSAFSRVMSIAMAGLSFSKCFIYLDDLIVFGKNMQHHNDNLNDIFMRLRKTNLKLNGSKCQFMKTELNYLGHKIVNGGILPDEDKVKAIMNHPTPKTGDEVKRFVAFVNYYRTHINKFAYLTIPLNRLTKKGVMFNWTEECDKAFHEIKKILSTAPLLEFPNFAPNNIFRLTTDASGYAVGAILSNGNGKPVSYASRALNKAERNYATIEKELLAIVWAVQHFRPYVFGRYFEVFTDHKPLESLFKMKCLNSRLAKFRLILNEYDFDVVFIKGIDNAGADCLSRINFQDIKNVTINAVTRSMKKEVENKPVEVLKREGTVIHFGKTIKKKNLPLISNFCHHDWEYNTIFVRQNHELDLVSTVFSLVEFFKNNKIKEVTVTSDDDCTPLMDAFVRRIKQFSELNKIYVLKGVEPVNDLRRRTIILNDYHLLPTGGHSGITKMVKNIKKRYTWTGLEKTVTDFVNKCQACQKSKIFKHIKSDLAITTTADQSFQKIYLDLVGPLPRDNSPYVYILTIQCELTKLVETVLLPDKSSETVARAFVDSFILRYGTPRCIATDQGKEFVSKLFQDVCEILEINHRTAAPYHPESIGALENTHKHLHNFLRIMVNERKSNWSEWVKYWTFSFNNSIHQSTGFTPHELVYGRICNIPTNEGRHLACKNYGDYPNELKKRLELAISSAKGNLNAAKEKIRTNFRGSALNNYQIGKKILLRNRARNSKLSNNYDNPGTIIHMELPNIVVKLENGSERKVHVNNTKLIE